MSASGSQQLLVSESFHSMQSDSRRVFRKSEIGEHELGRVQSPRVVSHTTATSSRGQATPVRVAHRMNKESKDLTPINESSDKDPNSRQHSSEFGQ